MAGKLASDKVEAVSAQERAGRQGVVMATWSDNIEAVARAVCRMRLAYYGVTEQQLAADMYMRWHLAAAEMECGVIDDSVEYYSGEIDWKRKMDGYRDWL